jgi:hypothetical protein
MSKPYFIVVRFVKQDRIKIWKDYNPYHTWGSAAYEILGYADTFREAKKIKADGVIVDS